jgi:hypothetical protein
MTREEALEQAIKNVKKLNADDEIIREFVTLMEKVSSQSSGLGYWYE